MSKWADYLVLRKHMNDEGTHIQSLEIAKDLGDNYATPAWVKRRDIIAMIADGITFCTAPPSPTKLGTGNVIQGATVHVTKAGWITTYPNQTTRDNLDNLPSG